MRFTRRKKLPTVLEVDEAKRLVKQPNKRYPTGLRNIAIMKTMLNMGLRVSEITNLKPSHIYQVVFHRTLFHPFRSLLREAQVLLHLF